MVRSEYRLKSKHGSACIVYLWEEQIKNRFTVLLSTLKRRARVFDGKF